MASRTLTLQDLHQAWQDSRNAYLGIDSATYSSLFGDGMVDTWHVHPRKCLIRLIGAFRVQNYGSDYSDDAIIISNNSIEIDMVCKPAFLYMLAKKHGIDRAMLWKLGPQELRLDMVEDVIEF